MNICKCGCGQTTKNNNTFIHGHNSRGKVGWSSGLTKETDDRIKRASESNIGRHSWFTDIDKSDPRYIRWHEATAAARHTDEARKKASEKTKLDWQNSPERREQQSTRMKERKLWQDESFVAKWHLARKRRPNKKELALEKLLDFNFPGIWKFTGDGHGTVGTKSPDFMHVYGEKVIELFGTYWHRAESGQEREEYFSDYGYDCLIVWEDELKREEILIQRIANFLDDSWKNVFREAKIDKYATKLCAVCGKEFLGHINRKTCSKQCRYELVKLSSRKIRAEIKCSYCGKKILIRQKLVGIKKYCSKQCYTLSMKGKPLQKPYNSHANIEKELARRAKLSMPRIQRFCVICNSVFSVKENTEPEKQLTCSRLCSYIYRGKQTSNRFKKTVN